MLLDAFTENEVERLIVGYRTYYKLIIYVKYQFLPPEEKTMQMKYIGETTHFVPHHPPYPMILNTVELFFNNLLVLKMSLFFWVFFCISITFMPYIK